MLDDALFYKKVFDDLEKMDTNYSSCPTPEEWKRIEMLTKFLKPFNEITKALSGSKYPTTNLYYRGVVEVYLILRDDCFFGSKFMEKTIDKMREKFNKYWEEYSMILSTVAVLDPRYKLEIIG